MHTVRIYFASKVRVRIVQWLEYGSGLNDFTYISTYKQNLITMLSLAFESSFPTSCL